MTMLNSAKFSFHLINIRTFRNCFNWIKITYDVIVIISLWNISMLSLFFFLNAFEMLKEITEIDGMSKDQLNAISAPRKQRNIFCGWGRIFEKAHCVQCRMHNKSNDGWKERNKNLPKVETNSWSKWNWQFFHTLNRWMLNVITEVLTSANWNYILWKKSDKRTKAWARIK